MEVSVGEFAVIAFIILVSVLIGYALGAPKKDDES
jgi:hypothetical protein